MAQQRNLSLDIIRTLACLMVILMHSPKSDNTAGEIVLSSISYLTAPCIGLFFMTSGALLLPIKESTAVFLRRRFSKIAVPTIIWSVFYLSINHVVENEGGNVFRAIASIPWGPQGTGVLWFMYALGGLYLLSPILSAWLRQSTPQEEKAYLSLWGITTCFPLLRLMFDVPEGVGNMLYSFSGYVGYFLLGHYLQHNRPKIPIWGISLLMGIPIGVVSAVKLSGTEIDFYQYFWYLSVFVVAMTIAWFSLLCRIHWHKMLPHKIVQAIALFSKASFGIYLVHIFVMRKCLWNIEPLNSLEGIAHIACVFLLTVSISWSFVVLVSYLPHSEWLVGFHSKK